jgi:hypothetical protein
MTSPNFALELHDSVLKRVDRLGEKVRLILSPAIIHESAGRPGHSPGQTHSGQVTVEIDQAPQNIQTGEIGLEITDGALTVPGESFKGIIPIPFEQTDQVSLELQLFGMQLMIEGVGCSIAFDPQSMSRLNDFPGSDD